MPRQSLDRELSGTGAVGARANLPVHIQLEVRSRGHPGRGQHELMMPLALARGALHLRRAAHRRTVAGRHLHRAADVHHRPLRRRDQVSDQHRVAVRIRDDDFRNVRRVHARGQVGLRFRHDRVIGSV